MSIESKLKNSFCSIELKDGTQNMMFFLDDGNINTLSNKKTNYSWVYKADILNIYENLELIFEFKLQEIGSFYLLFIQNQDYEGANLLSVKKKLQLLRTLTSFTNRDDERNGYLEVGEHTHGGKVEIIAKEHGKVIIGDYTGIGPDVVIVAGNHRTDLVTIYPFTSILELGLFGDDNTTLINDHISKGNVEIGNDVWLGHSVQIMPGVKIGDGAIVAANAVVTKNIEPYTIVGGNPAKFIKYRIEDESLRKDLLDIAWWNWPEDKVKENLPKIMSADIKSFVEEFKNAS
ncbi:CatB-related O-acetyltransferase [Acinetobacter dispersus]|uniref:Acetyltransferase n=1 Tax=Acinetobacter dispersus TaxID=70348 RepID=N9MJA4_9GAMM|nr:CatB-related O-acetyltransferase [Acinetobacter dispersus]ENW93375.1 hypothetical protein F904_01431 [Acinetobacter dispersus]